MGSRLMVWVFRGKSYTAWKEQYYSKRTLLRDFGGYVSPDSWRKWPLPLVDVPMIRGPFTSGRMTARLLPPACCTTARWCRTLFLHLPGRCKTVAGILHLPGVNQASELKTQAELIRHRSLQRIDWARWRKKQPFLVKIIYQPLQGICRGRSKGL